MYDRERVRRPHGKHDEEDEAGEIDGAASAKTAVAADEDHQHVGDPHGDGEKNFGVGEEGGADGLECDDRADEKAGGHAWETEEQSFEGDLVEDFERWQEAAAGGGALLLEAALFDEIKQAGDEREEECGVGGEEQRYVEEQPAGADEGVGDGLVPGVKRRDDGKQDD